MNVGQWCNIDWECAKVSNFSLLCRIDWLLRIFKNTKKILNVWWVFHFCSWYIQRMGINIVPCNFQYTPTQKYWVILITCFNFENSNLITKRILTFLSERSSETEFYTYCLCGHYFFQYTFMQVWILYLFLWKTNFLSFYVFYMFCVLNSTPHS